jgi:hypothetical protein
LVATGNQAIAADGSRLCPEAMSGTGDPGGAATCR